MEDLIQGLMEDLMEDLIHRLDGGLMEHLMEGLMEVLMEDSMEYLMDGLMEDLMEDVMADVMEDVMERLGWAFRIRTGILTRIWMDLQLGQAISVFGPGFGLAFDQPFLKALANIYCLTLEKYYELDVGLMEDWRP